MLVTVQVWASLSHLFGAEPTGRRSFEVDVAEGTTLEGLLRTLAERNPRFRAVMLDSATGELSDQVTAVVNGRLPELLQGYETPLHTGDRVALVQAYAGG